MHAYASISATRIRTSFVRAFVVEKERSLKERTESSADPHDDGSDASRPSSVSTSRPSLMCSLESCSAVASHKCTDPAL